MSERTFKIPMEYEEINNGAAIVENRGESQAELGRELDKEQKRKIGGLMLFLTGNSINDFAAKRDKRLEELESIDLAA